MQINNSRCNVNFGSKPLYRVKLKGGVVANFAEVFPQNPYDNEAVTKLLSTWVSSDPKNDYIKIFRETWSNLQNGHRHYVIELVEKGKSLSDRIVAFACTSNPKSNFKSHNFWEVEDKNKKSDFGLYYLETINAIKSDRKVGGAGELLVYGLVKLAQKYDFDMFSLTSTNDGFYEKIGFKTDFEKYGNAGAFFLDAKDYNPFLSRVEKKYGFKN